MVEKRQATGQPQGAFLAHLLNQKLDKRDWMARSLQLEVENVFNALITLAEKLPATGPDADWSIEIKNSLDQVNAFLETCAEHPRVFPGRAPGEPPFLVQEFAPVFAGAMRRNAVSSTCALVRYGLLDRVRRCKRCGRWFFAKKSDSWYHSRTCQALPTEEKKRRKREYAKRYYRQEKERNQQAALKAQEELKVKRGGSK
jgi:hypothetical protein